MIDVRDVAAAHGMCPSASVRCARTSAPAGSLSSLCTPFSAHDPWPACSMSHTHTRTTRTHTIKGTWTVHDNAR